MKILIKYLGVDTKKKLGTKRFVKHVVEKFIEFTDEDSAARFVEGLILPMHLKGVFIQDTELERKLQQKSADLSEDKEYQEFIRLSAKYGRNTIHTGREQTDDSVLSEHRSTSVSSAGYDDIRYGVPGQEEDGTNPTEPDNAR